MLDRRLFLASCSKVGLGATLFPGTLWALAHRNGTVTKEMIERAAVIADVPIPAEFRDAMLASLNDHVDSYDAIHELHLPNSVAPALNFDPTLPSTTIPVTKRPMRMSSAPVLATRGVPRNIEDLCYATVRHLASLMRNRKISSVALTDMYLARLARLDPTLHCVITLTEDRARTQAAEADRAIATGKYRGPLHGLPWGAKDLLAVKGYPTTWGAGGFEHQTIDEDATAVQRLDAAGPADDPLEPWSGRHGVVVVDGQAGPHLPVGRGLRARTRRDLWTRRARPHGPPQRLQLGRDD